MLVFPPSRTSQGNSISLAWFCFEFFFNHFLMLFLPNLLEHGGGVDGASHGLSERLLGVSFSFFFFPSCLATQVLFYFEIFFSLCMFFVPAKLCAVGG